MVHLPKKILSGIGLVPQNTISGTTGIPSMERKSRVCPGWGSRSWAGASGLPCCVKVRVVDGQGMSLGVEHPILQGQHIIFREQKIEVPEPRERDTQGLEQLSRDSRQARAARCAGAAACVHVTHSQLPGKSPPFPLTQLCITAEPFKPSPGAGTNGSAAGNSQSFAALPRFPPWKDPENSSHSSSLPWAGTPPLQEKTSPSLSEAH